MAVNSVDTPSGASAAFRQPLPPLGNGRHFPRSGAVLLGQGRLLTPAEQFEEAGGAHGVFHPWIISEA